MAWIQTGMCALAAAALSACSLLPIGGNQTETATSSLRISSGLDGRDGEGLRIARYTSARAVPAEDAREPMSVIAQIHYPRETVRTVGDAVHHTLLRTGWRLNETALGVEASDVLGLPLPDSHRVLGPYAVRTILHVLLSWEPPP